MAELVYAPVIAAAVTAFRLLDMRFTVEGAEHVPTSGGAVMAGTHTSYLDFLHVGYAARPSRRYVRFMCKESVFRHPVAGPLMRAMHHIPVDRAAGASSYAAALRALQAGEVVGVFPEATISTSFTVKRIKTGSERMAAATKVPLIPVATWGGQRLMTKGHKPRARRHVPVTILVGEPIDTTSVSRSALGAELAARMSSLLTRAQDTYPDKPAPGEDPWWLPTRLGGTAPTPEQAAAELEH